jgi:pantothenate kinase
VTTFETVDAIADFLTALPPIPSRRIIGVTGPPGAGKSTIGELLVRRVPASALLPMDGYHLPQLRLVELGRRERMGAPDTFDVDVFLGTLAELRISGGTVFAPSFDRELEEPVPDALAIRPELTTVVVEGNYLLHDSGGWEAVREQLDLVFFVDVPRPIRLHRLIDRHVRFGKTPDAAEAWAFGPDEDNARLIEATSSRADHVIRLD